MYHKLYYSFNPRFSHTQKLDTASCIVKDPTLKIIEMSFCARQITDSCAEYINEIQS